MKQPSSREEERPWRPTRQQLQEAAGKGVPDVIAPGLRVLFAGINPGLYSAAVGHHFGRPGNRFWPALHAAGLTPRLISPFAERQILQWELGISNISPRATVAADELSAAELMAGAKVLERKVRRYRPAIVAFLGITAYRIAFARPGAQLGEQPDKIGASRLWVLPNPSGLNAHHSLADLAARLRALREAAML